MFTPTTQVAGTNSAKLEAYVYRPELIPLVWGEMENVLEKCFEKTAGILSAEQVYQWLTEGTAIAFATVKENRLEAVLIVTKVNYAKYSIARIVACGGMNLKGAMQFIDALEAWAFTHGCVEIEAWCETPVARLVRRYGWKSKLTIVSRDLRRKLQ